MQPDMPDKEKIPFTADQPRGSGVLPRAEQVIRSNVPQRLSGMQLPQTNAQKDFELKQYIVAHSKLVQQLGKLVPMLAARDIQVGNTVIPAELVKHIGEWAVPVVAGPEVFKKPGEEW